MVANFSMIKYSLPGEGGGGGGGGVHCAACFKDTTSMAVSNASYIVVI